MNAIDAVMLLASATAVGAYLFRLEGLQWTQHQPSVIVMHMAFCAACGAATGHAWTGDTGLIDVATVIGAWAWIRVSFPSWRSGPPDHVITAPSPLYADTESISEYERARVQR